MLYARDYMLLSEPSVRVEALSATRAPHPRQLLVEIGVALRLRRRFTLPRRVRRDIFRRNVGVDTVDFLLLQRNSC